MMKNQLRTRSAPCGAVAVLFTLLAGPAHPAILRVPDDHALIGDAIAAAIPGDEIWVSAAGSPYVQDTTLTLVDNVTYRGGWDANFLSQDPTRTRIELLSGATGSVIDASLTSSAVTFASFLIGPAARPATPATAQGGGMFIGPASPLIGNCVFENNTSDASGGAIQIAAGSATHLLDCTFDGNETGFTPGGGRGGAVAVGPGADQVWIEHCRFTNNLSDSLAATTSAAGAALFTASGILLERCRFEQNFSGVDGGALYVRDANIRSWGNLFYFNTAGRHGGAIYHQNGDGEHNGILIEDCVAGAGGNGNGGGAYFEGGSNRLFDSFVRRCVADSLGDGSTTGVGGGLFYFQPLLGAQVRGSEITGNIAASGGGIGVQGTIVRSFSEVRVAQNTIVGNRAVGSDPAVRCRGGGIHIFDDFIGEIVDNVVTEQADGCAITCEGLLASPNIRFNCVWNGPGNTDPEYGENCSDRTGINGNIRANPGMCCAATGCIPNMPDPQPDVQLGIGSPCLGTGEGGADMGAYPGSSGCMTPVSLKQSSWGMIKSLYK